MKTVTSSHLNILDDHTFHIVKRVFNYNKQYNPFPDLSIGFYKVCQKLSRLLFVPGDPIDPFTANKIRTQITQSGLPG